MTTHNPDHDIRRLPGALPAVTVSTPRARRIRWLPLWLMIVASAAGEPDAPDADNDRRQENRQRVESWTQTMRREADDDPDKLVKFGLLADRGRREVRFWAEATGIQEGHAVEFVLISQRSGHDYEALAVSMVDPSDIHEALTFIGMPPGKPVDPARLRFWPRGERVWVDFIKSPGGDEHGDQTEKIAAEKLLHDRDRRQSPPVKGFVFTGSTQRPDPRTGDPVYAADHFGPHAIVSLYNEPFSVMDVPRLAAQSDVYGSITPNPDHVLEPDQLLEIRLTPESAPQKPRVFSGSLRILAADDATPPRSAADLRFSIDPHDAQDRAPALEGANLIEFLAWLEHMKTTGRDPFIKPRPAPHLPWGAVRAFYQSLQALEGDGGIRIEPPDEDRLYYRAFLPADWFRDRQHRTAHPDELHLDPRPDTKENDTKSMWKRFEEEWPDARSLEPIIHVHSQSVADAAGLLAAHQTLEYRPMPAVLLVFAPLQTPLETLHEWMIPLRETYPTQYLFAPDPE